MLLEVLVAMAILVVGVVVLAQLFVVSAHADRIAGTTSATVLLATRKMEALLGDAAVGLSPPGTLSINTAEYVDYLDAHGTSLGIESPGTAPPGTAYIRRWSSEASPGSVNNAVVLQVLVLPASSSQAGARAPGATHLVALKTGTPR
jgi:hypothetical protein